MTCIIGLVHEDRVYMRGDSAATGAKAVRGYHGDRQDVDALLSAAPIVRSYFTVRTGIL